ncbi:MAG TPA: hypothetical protein VI076_02775 [Actinopolymorphaceae bacterium]
MGTEALWQVGEISWVVVDQHAEQAGHALVTFGVEGLDAILEAEAPPGVRPPGAGRARCGRYRRHD